MNCLEFRRLCLSEPWSRDPEYLAHQRECSGCRAFAAEQAAFNRRLMNAMQVPVPEKLGATTMLEGRLNLHHRRRLGAIAAAVLAGLALLVGLHLGPSASLEDALAAHIKQDPIHRRPPADWRERELAAMVQRLGGRLEASPGAVQHVTYCPIEGKAAAHLVLEGKNGPVVAFLLPEHRVAEARKLFAEDMDGLLAPMGRGAIALFGGRGESLEVYRERLSRNIHWPA